MSRHWYLFAVAVVVACGAGQSPETPNPEALYREGLEQIELNCGDCLNATRGGMEGGIKRVERALTLGYERRADAYEVLAKGYNTLALVYSDRGSEERRQYEQKRNEAYKKLTDLAPGNAKYVRKYARAMTSHEEREALYRRAIRVNRDDLELRVGLISTLLQLNKIGEATEETNALIKMGSVQEQRELLEALVSELRDKGASDAAARLEAVVSAGR